MADVPDLKTCYSCRPGHTVHMMQGLRYGNMPELHVNERSGRVASIDGEVITVALADGSEQTFRNHDTPRLRAILDWAGDRDLVRINDRFSLLLVPSYTRRRKLPRLENGSWCISIASDVGQPLGRCPTERNPPAAQGGTYLG